MSDKIKLYKCRGYLFCIYELLEKSTTQIAKEYKVHRHTILYWLRKFNIKRRTIREARSGKSWKDDIGYHTIHKRAHKVDLKPVDGKCAICNKIADKKGITKLVHSNKDHTYRLPINPEEWWWIHKSCHEKYDAPETKEKQKKVWTPEKRKEQADRARERNKKYWTPDKRKKYSENNPMKRPGVIAKMLKTKRKNRANKIKETSKSKKPKPRKDKGQVSYWLGLYQVFL